MTHQCYYCEQIFDSKEKLFDHVESHNKTLDEMAKKALKVKPKKKTGLEISRKKAKRKKK